MRMKRDARIAGFLYVLLGVIAPMRLIYVPNAILVSGDAHATAMNIASHALAFRMAILADALAGTLTLIVALALFRVFRSIDRDLACLMVIFGGLMVAPIYFFNLVNDAAALVIASGPSYLSGFDQTQREGLASLFLRMHGYGIVVNQMFWGLWLLPLAALIIKSGLIPRFVAYWLYLNGAAYVALCVFGILSPSLEAKASGILFPAMLGEVVTMVWLAVGRLQPGIELIDGVG